MTLKELICAVYMHLMPLHCWPLESSLSVKAHVWRNRVLICPEVPSALVPGSSDLVSCVCGVLFCTFKDTEPNESSLFIFLFSSPLPLFSALWRSSCSLVNVYWARGSNGVRVVLVCAVCWSVAKKESVARKFSGFGSFLLFPLKTPVPFLGESSQMEY